MKPTIRPRTVATLASGLVAMALLVGAVAAGDARRGRETADSMMVSGMSMTAGAPMMDPSACPCAGDPAAHHAAMHGNASMLMHAAAMRSP